MFKEKMLSISIFSLAISIVISSFILTKGMKNNGQYVGGGLSDIGIGLRNFSSNVNPSNYNMGIPKDNYSLAEAAIYLRIEQNKLVELVDNKGIRIPHIKIGSDYIFNKNALDKWLETAQIEIK